jgi:ribosome-binding factor A
VTRRTERVGEQIRDVLARLLREEVTDPRIGLVTLTRVDVAPDFSNARVYWSALRKQPSGTALRKQPSAPDEGLEPELATAAGLASAAGFLRRGLARELPLRRTPELHFVHDPSLAAGANVLAILQELRDGSA